MERDKIAFVCQRYGAEVNGGAEQYCRQLAEKLSAVYDVEIYTTCAIDYISWANAYRKGIEEINGVKVYRFRNKKERKLKRFAKTSKKVLNGVSHTDREEELWIVEQGPVCPELLDALYEHRKEYKSILFVTYLYYLAVRGLSLNFENAILIPTVHDEAPVYLRCYDRVFNAAKGIAWNTPEEKDFALRRFGKLNPIAEEMTGIGIEPPAGELPQLPEQIQNCRYITYAGRIDESKGCGEMFDYYLRYKQQYGNDIKLVLMGKPVMPVPEDPDIINLGFVTDEMKFAVMKSAVALVLFSHFESLSMVVLESMLMGKPVLVTEKCDVLKGHCVRSNAGLYFADYPEFAATLNYLLTHEQEYQIMCENGKKYVNEHYQWDVIVRKFCRLIEAVAQNANDE